MSVRILKCTLSAERETVEKEREKKLTQREMKTEEVRRSKRQKEATTT